MIDIQNRFKLLLPQPRHIELTGDLLNHSPAIQYSVSQSITPQGYEIRIDTDSIQITHRDEPGKFYADQTLTQLQQLFGQGLPMLVIRDWPDYPSRGVMLDISRDKVPTIGTLKMIIDELAMLKINQLQLYMEHTFAYRDHEVVWKDASPITSEEIDEIREYCTERFIELVPNQNSFGHMERWLKHEKYRRLAESPEGSVWPDGTKLTEPFSLCPTDTASLELLDGLYAELLPHFTSNLFNVGCDETFDLGQPGTRSEAICQSRGKHVVYLDFLKQIHGLCRKYGRRVMFWGDIILEAPELIPQLPQDSIALEWGYEGDHPFDQRLQKLRQAGLDLYVCPGTSSWLTFAGRTQNAIDNLTNAAEAGIKHGAIGYLITDWGDFGHLQYWPVSYLPIAHGAGVAWCLETNRDVDVCEALNQFIFLDKTNKTAQLFRDLGNVYQTSKQIGNSTLLFRIFQQNGSKLEKTLEGVDLEMLKDQESRIKAIASRLSELSSSRNDHVIIKLELDWTMQSMIFCCRRGRQILGDPDIDPAANQRLLKQLQAMQQSLWLYRNREGGLLDSQSRYSRLMHEI